MEEYWDESMSQLKIEYEGIFFKCVYCICYNRF